jgi:hypothetical protein
MNDIYCNKLSFVSTSLTNKLENFLSIEVFYMSSMIAFRDYLANVSCLSLLQSDLIKVFKEVQMYLKLLFV